MQVKILFGLFLTFLLRFPASAAESNWTLLQTGEEKTVSIMVDYASLKRQGEVSRIWTMLNFANAQTLNNGSKYLSSLVHVEINCNKELHRIGYMHVAEKANGQGKLLMMSEGSIKWSPVVPESLSSTVFAAVCK